ncbi:S-adenosyl-L-methionine-dependent methyltransferase [Auriscalpium vulgare]|uniref:S-adenosyl-L-methionine-dependent methyltransferase n=1 Tax=Auriscalpium vulgare TaxID=40419 RepID=A0ACB8S0Y1_9AGAM|nr:S-adenosyl-L-methionine-dependent methyltransferase [Auriscalpium vulgare]
MECSEYCTPLRQVYLMKLAVHTAANSPHHTTSPHPTPVMNTIEQLKALSEIIQTSIQRIEEATSSHSLSLSSLDTPVSAETLEAAYALPDVVAAGVFITAAAGQLTSIVRPPAMTVLNYAMQFHVSTAIGTAVETYVAEILRDAGPEGLHAEAIAKYSGVDFKKLARVLRLLATNHVFREVSPDVFAQNRLSSILDSGKSVESMIKSPETRFTGTLGVTATIGHVTDEAFKASAYLTETLLDPVYGASGRPDQTAFSKAFNTDVDMWQLYESPGNAHRLVRFGSAMDGFKNMSPPNAILEGFDWSGLSEGSLVVDVGGGIGAHSLTLAKNHPHLKFIVQDREAVVKNGLKYWNQQLPGAIESKQVQLQAHSFFDPQPVTTAAVFLIRMILHDWSDDYCVKILRHLRAAATADTRLVVVDQIMSYACDEDTVKDIPGAVHPPPPAPLLPNLGHASLISYYTDHQMLGLFNAQERTLTQAKELLAQGGWKIIAVNHGAAHFGFSTQKTIAVPV